MAEPRAFPWPPGVKVPRWARGRRDRIELPSVYGRLQLDNLDRYRVGLYRLRGVFPHVVEIIEHADGTISPTVKITTVYWPRDPLEVFQEAQTKYVALSQYFGDNRN
jgi:hypothetical protein